MSDSFRKKAIPKQQIPILFVRHGQSTNNPILERLVEKLRQGELTPAEFPKTWGEERVDDPDLTSIGKTEAMQLGKFLHAGLKKKYKIVVYTSAFKRALDTTKSIVKLLPSDKCSVIVHPSIFEIGGVYFVNDKGERDGPGKCLTAKKIHEEFGYDVSMLPQNGPWYIDGWESDGKGRQRAKLIANWLKSAKFHKLHQNVLVILVMHAHFIDNLTKAMLGVEDDPSLDPLTTNIAWSQPVFFVTKNSGTSLFLVSKEGRVFVQWINRIDHLECTAENVLSKL